MMALPRLARFMLCSGDGPTPSNRRDVLTRGMECSDLDRDRGCQAGG